MKKVTIILALLAVVLGGFLFWWTSGIQPVNSSNKEKVVFVVTKGASIREIGSDLKNKGLIKNAVIFFLYVKQSHLERTIQAGTYQLSPSQSTEEIARTLTVGRDDTRVQIIEGVRAEEIADMLQKIFPQYSADWLVRLKENEGYLFPETYFFNKDATIDDIISTLKNTFDQRFAQIQNHTTLTNQELVIFASVIQREGHSDDLPIISSVLHNRLEDGMPLQVDATIQYALGYDPYEKTWWKKDLTFDDLKIASPYNTYTHTGLPPTPISNPGSDALNAAANPADTDYFYYITDKHGVNHYAKTAAEHNANIKKYGL